MRSESACSEMKPRPRGICAVTPMATSPDGSSVEVTITWPKSCFILDSCSGVQVTSTLRDAFGAIVAVVPPPSVNLAEFRREQHRLGVIDARHAHQRFGFAPDLLAEGVRTADHVLRRRCLSMI